MRNQPAAFKITKPYEGFHVGQTVYRFRGPTYGVEVPGEVPVTVAPDRGPFVGLTPEYLAPVATH